VGPNRIGVSISRNVAFYSCLELRTMTALKPSASGCLCGFVEQGLFREKTFIHIYCLFLHHLKVLTCNTLYSHHIHIVNHYSKSNVIEAANNIIFLEKYGLLGCDPVWLL
jgi:hypothetical protein